MLVINNGVNMKECRVGTLYPGPSKSGQQLSVDWLHHLLGTQTERSDGLASTLGKDPEEHLTPASNLAGLLGLFSSSASRTTETSEQFGVGYPLDPDRLDPCLAETHKIGFAVDPRLLGEVGQEACTMTGIV